MNLKRDTDHVFTISAITNLIGSSVSYTDATEIAWQAKKGEFAVAYCPDAKTVKVNSWRLSEMKFFAVVGYCNLHEIRLVIE